MELTNLGVVYYYQLNDLEVLLTKYDPKIVRIFYSIFRKTIGIGILYLRDTAAKENNFSCFHLTAPDQSQFLICEKCNLQSTPVFWKFS